MPDTHEPLYRLLCGLATLLFFLLRHYFIHRYPARAKQLSRQPMRERTAYAAMHVAYGVALLYALTPWLDAAQLPLPAALRWLGLGLIAAAMALYAWTHRSLGSLWSGLLEISLNHRLVRSGPYRRVRHPMYTAFFIYVAGMLLLSANALAGGIPLLVTCVMYAGRVRAEEQMMLEQFGEDYRAYMARTGRLLPRLGRRR